jgi:hypothetical protein
MKIHLSYVAARNRATGEIETLVHIESLLGGADVSPIARLLNQFTGGTPEGAELRAKYSHVLGVVENQERHVLEFPDPAIAQREQKARELAAAREEAERKAADERAAKAAAANVKTITAERKEADTRVAILEQELEAIVPAPAAPLLPPPLESPAPSIEAAALGTSGVPVTSGE